MSPVEEKFLHALAAKWPRHALSGTVMTNVAEIAKRASLSEDESKAAAHSLQQQGLLHLREIAGVVFVHPTQAAIDAVSKQGTGFFERLFGWAK